MKVTFWVYSVRNYTVMKLLLSVIDELYSFAIESLFRREKHKEESVADILLNDVPVSDSVDVSSVSDDVGIDTVTDLENIDSTHEFRSIGDIVSSNENELRGEKNTVMYIGGEETPIYINPTREFDSVIEKLSYGAMVMVLEQSGRWAKVVHNGVTGWTLREDLIDRAAYVYPQFHIDGDNTSEGLNTIRVRAILDDIFAGAAADLPPQAPEYGAYRLMRKGIDIKWSDVRPRTPGVWHKLLKGVQGVHVGVVPKTGSVMEYMMTSDTGHLAYVEAVFPEETINISEVNYPDSGIYNERVLTHEEWRELRPLFIEFT